MLIIGILLLAAFVEMGIYLALALPWSWSLPVRIPVPFHLLASARTIGVAAVLLAIGLVITWTEWPTTTHLSSAQVARQAERLSIQSPRGAVVPWRQVVLNAALPASLLPYLDGRIVGGLPTGIVAVWLTNGGSWINPQGTGVFWDDPFIRLRASRANLQAVLTGSLQGGPNATDVVRILVGRLPRMVARRMFAEVGSDGANSPNWLSGGIFTTVQANRTLPIDFVLWEVARSGRDLQP